MPLSKECQEYHLTLQGWISGTFKGDALGGSIKQPIPKDRVLTVVCCDELNATFTPYIKISIFLNNKYFPLL